MWGGGVRVRVRLLLLLLWLPLSMTLLGRELDYIDQLGAEGVSFTYCEDG